VPVNLSTAWIIALNVAGWPVIHLTVAWLFTRLPATLFMGNGPSRFNPSATEAQFYSRIGGVRNWKNLLPDGAPWLRGFAKRRLQSTEPAYLQAFIAETCRGELAHWIMMLAGGVFFLWNPLWADAVMAGYAVAANVPCIVTQRYNRFRLDKLLRLKLARPAGVIDGRAY
jgi:glycosyl-4,4'-diaponeurosporenoate acyltransferase